MRGRVGDSSPDILAIGPNYRRPLPPVALTVAGQLGRGRPKVGEPTLSRSEVSAQVRMMRRPAGRFFTIPFPPLPFAARIFAAFILPPRLFFAMVLRGVPGYLVPPLVRFH